MPKFTVTLTSYQTCIIEAEDENEALSIAHYQTSQDDWDDPFIDPSLEVKEYTGDKNAFNEK